MGNSKSEEKIIISALILVLTVFITIALVSIFKYGNTLLLGSIQKFDNDDVKYIRSAWNLIDNNILSYENTEEPTVFIMPGLTFTLSFFMILFGKFGGITAFKIFQVILQGVSLYLIFIIGRKVFGSKTALIACILDALYAVEIFVSNTILMECIFKFLLLLLICISIYAVERKSLKLYIAGGIVWGLACLFRPTIAAYPIVILIMWIKNKYTPMEIIKYTIFVLGIFCLTMLPWWIRNYVDFNMFIPFTKSSGNPFLQGTFINYDQSSGWGVPYTKGANSFENDQNQIDAGLKRLALYAQKQPVRYILWYTVGKTFYFWHLPFYWRSVFYIPRALVNIFHLIILSLGIKSIVCKAKKSVNAELLFNLIILFNIVYLPFYTFERYSYPVMPLVMIFAAAELNKLCKRKRWKLLWKRI